MQPIATYNISTRLPPQPPAARNFATYKCNALHSNVPTKKRYRVIQYRSALVARTLFHQATPILTPRCKYLYCIALVAPLLTQTYCTTPAEFARLLSKVQSKLQIKLQSKLQRFRGASCNKERLAATLTSRPRRPACLGPL